MYEVSVSTSFHATHAVTIAGVEETPHDHNWNVVATVEGETLAEDGLLVDFLALRVLLENAIDTIRDTNLNTSDALDHQNPTTELVAWYIATQLCPHIQPPTKLSSVKVTEAPNCIAIYRL